MRVFLSGQKAFGADVFRLAWSMPVIEIVGVSSPAFAGCGVKPDRLRAQADLRGVPWVQAGRLNAETLPDDVDLIVAAHSHDFIGRKTRLRARLGGIGYHPSLLPRHRGRDAIRWTVHMGDPITGGTVYWLSDRVDGGDIAAQDFVFVDPNETADSLWREKLAPLGVSLMQATLEDLIAGVMRREPQDEAFATWEPSWNRAPLARPDLELLGGPIDGVQIVRRAARRG